MTIPIDPPPPPYNTQIPESETTIANAQTLFQNNFKRLFEAFNMNHVSLDDPTNPGNHNVIQLIELSTAEATQSQEIAIYSKKVDGQTDQLFMRYQGNGKEFQITEYQIYSIVPTSQQEAYFTFLPGKIIVYFGRVFSRNSNSFNIDINPPVTKNVSGLNLCGVIDVVGANFSQPNVQLQFPVNGLYNQIKLNSQSAMLDNFYLFFGNL